MSGDPEQDYFSDGITEDIIAELGKFREFLVIARNSSFQFRGKANDLAEVAKKLGVQYVVEGSVRKIGNPGPGHAQLIDASSTAHVWGEHYDRELDDIFAIQDEVVRTIAATLVGRLNQAALERAKNRASGDLRAYDHYLRPLSIWSRGHRKTIGWRGNCLRPPSRPIRTMRPRMPALAEAVFRDRLNGWSIDPQRDFSAFHELRRVRYSWTTRTAALMWRSGSPPSTTDSPTEPASTWIEQSSLIPATRMRSYHFSRLELFAGNFQAATDRVPDALRLIRSANTAGIWAKRITLPSAIKKRRRS